MQRLRVEADVDLPYGSIGSALRRYFASRIGRDGAARIPVRVPTVATHVTPCVRFEREVYVEVRMPEGARAASAQVSWRPEGSAVFPSFDGRLAWHRLPENAGARIAVDGFTTPPGEDNGYRFDPAIGAQLAEATAHAFLLAVRLAVARMGSALPARQDG